jgi:hypothetical protein
MLFGLKSNNRRFGGYKILRNAGNYSHKNTVSHPRRFVSSASNAFVRTSDIGGAYEDTVLCSVTPKGLNNSAKDSEEASVSVFRVLIFILKKESHLQTFSLYSPLNSTPFYTCLASYKCSITPLKTKLICFI